MYRTEIWVKRKTQPCEDLGRGFPCRRSSEGQSQEVRQDDGQVIFPGVSWRGEQMCESEWGTQ